MKLRLMKAEECVGHSLEYAMGWKACIEWIKNGGDEQYFEPEQTEYERGRQDALEELMEYTYGMLEAEKFGLQHKIRSMMDEDRSDR